MEMRRMIQAERRALRAARAAEPAAPSPRPRARLPTSAGRAAAAVARLTLTEGVHGGRQATEPAAEAAEAAQATEPAEAAETAEVTEAEEATEAAEAAKAAAARYLSTFVRGRKPLPALERLWAEQLAVRAASAVAPRGPAAADGGGSVGEEARYVESVRRLTELQQRTCEAHANPALGPLPPVLVDLAQRLRRAATP